MIILLLWALVFRKLLYLEMEEKKLVYIYIIIIFFGGGGGDRNLVYIFDGV